MDEVDGLVGESDHSNKQANGVISVLLTQMEGKESLAIELDTRI